MSSPPTWGLVLAGALAAGLLSSRLGRRYGADLPAPAMVGVQCAVAALAAWRFPHAGLASTLILVWSLVLLAAIDLVVLRLPDAVTLPLALLGLLAAVVHDPRSLPDHAGGAAAGYLSIALLGWAFARLRGRPGIGMGDAKLLACAGAWLGWRLLPAVVLIASAAGLAYAAVLMLRGGRSALTAPIPFGAALALAIGWVWLLADPAERP